MKPRPKRCRVCREKFSPFNSMQAVCFTVKCAAAYAREQRKKKELREAKEWAAETRRRKEAAKSRQDWLKEAQAEFNKFIRERDADEPCISCGRHHQGQYHAGHYRTVGACPELRFNEANCHKQCAPCNNHLSGNIVEYRINLIRKIGQAAIDWLEGPHEPAKYTIEEIKEIKREYREKTRELKRKKEAA